MKPSIPTDDHARTLFAHGFVMHYIVHIDDEDDPDPTMALDHGREMFDMWIEAYVAAEVREALVDAFDHGLDLVNRAIVDRTQKERAALIVGHGSLIAHLAERFDINLEEAIREHSSRRAP